VAPRRNTPRYLQIAAALRARIRAGDGSAGRRLPSEHTLRARFSVSRMTVRHALEVLRQEGLLSRHVGRGTFTSPVVTERRLRVIGSVEDMLALGDETWFKPLEKRAVAAPEGVARALRLAPGAPLIRFSGVRHGDDGPFQYVTAYVPERIGRQILDEDLSSTSVIGTVERRLGLSVRYLEQAIEVERCPKEVADHLGVRGGVPILCFHRTYFTDGGEPVEHAVTYHWAPRYPYTMMLYRTERRG
jgi:GntR family transcriptional regulator